MKEKITGVAKEMKMLFFQIIKEENIPDSLTSIQKQEYHKELTKKYNNQGINYFLDKIYGGHPENRYIEFKDTSWFVNDIGLIADIKIDNIYPISLIIDENITIEFEPRKLDNQIRTYGSPSLKTPQEYLNLNKGSKFTFEGKITSCRYFWNPNQESFSFKIINTTSTGGWFKKIF
jgi:hypothetical protein